MGMRKAKPLNRNRASRDRFFSFGINGAMSYYGYGVLDDDPDGDTTLDCNDGCPSDPNKIQTGICGCSIPDTDSDEDGCRRGNKMGFLIYLYLIYKRVMKTHPNLLKCIINQTCKMFFPF